MSDAYGGISLLTSKDSVIDADLLTKTLNSFSWTNNKGVWKSQKINSEITFWHHVTLGTQYPTAFPERIVKVKIYDESGKKKVIPFEDALEEHFDDDFELITEELSLKELSKLFTKTISSGWFEIACCANDKNSYLYYQSMRVYSDGKITTKSISSGTYVGVPMDETEEYIPG